MRAVTMLDANDAADFVQADQFDILNIVECNVIRIAA